MHIEPGKFLVSECGYFLTKVNYVNNRTNKNFIHVNSGLNHFVRPMFYGSKHAIENISSNSEEIKNYSVVGYICERKDFFGLSSYVQAASYSSTLLFSLIPGMSEIFTRLPAGNPLADSIFDPILQKTFLFLTFLFFCLITYQSYWIRFKSKA